MRPVCGERGGDVGDGDACERGGWGTVTVSVVSNEGRRERGRCWWVARA